MKKIRPHYYSCIRTREERVWRRNAKNMFKFKPFQATGVFLYPLWKQENPCFFCFQGYGKRTLTWWRVTKENIDFLNMLKVNNKDTRLTSIDVFLLFSSLILIRFHLWIKKKIWLINIVFLIFSDQYSISVSPENVRKPVRKPLVFWRF